MSPGCLRTAIAGALLLVGTCSYQALRPVSPEEEAKRVAERRLVDTYYHCQDKVTERLRSPSTANFPSSGSRDVKARQQDDSTFVVLAWVDAQNAYGGTVRNTFLCEITYGAEGWRLSSLNISG